jgi:hypothetical protein
MSQLIDYIKKPFFIWIIANILGFGALGIALLVIPSLMSVSGIFGSTLIISIPISLAQWIALRWIFPTSKLWILSIPVGILLVILIIRELPDWLWQIVDDQSPAALAVGYLLIGLIIALPQWLLLRHQFSNSSIWLLGSSIGVALGFGLVLATDLINQSTIISYIVAVFVYAISTGLILSRLIDYHNQSQSNRVTTA